MLSDCSTKVALSWRDIRYTIYNARSNAVLKLLTPFVLKEWKNFCLLNLMKNTKTIGGPFGLHVVPFFLEQETLRLTHTEKINLLICA